MLKSLISKGLSVPHRCENRYIYTTTWYEKFVAMNLKKHLITWVQKG
jgi:hypothetical protein